MQFVILKSDGTIIGPARSGLSVYEQSIYSLIGLPLPATSTAAFSNLLRARRLKYLNGGVKDVNGNPINMKAAVRAEDFELPNEVEICRLFDKSFEPSREMFPCKFLYELMYDKRYPSLPRWDNLRLDNMLKWYQVIDLEGARRVFWAYAYGGFGALIEALLALPDETKTAVLASEVFTEEDKANFARIGIS